MLFRQRIKRVTHVAELPSFAQDSTRMHRIHGFLRTQGKKACCLSSGGLKEGSWGLTPDSNSPSKSSKYDQAAGHAFVLRRGDLATPTRISPAPATE
jgi:hypothetical protein